MFQKNLIFHAVLVLTIACVPNSSKSYIKSYAAFIDEVKKESSFYTQKNWKEADEKFDCFAIKWYAKFERELTWREQLDVARYYAEYKTYRTNTEIIDVYTLLLREDYETLKEQLIIYTENDMPEDIERLMKEAREISYDAVHDIEQALKELKIQTDKTGNAAVATIEP